MGNQRWGKFPFPGDLDAIEEQIRMCRNAGYDEGMACAGDLADPVGRAANSRIAKEEEEAVLSMIEKYVLKTAGWKIGTDPAAPGWMGGGTVGGGDPDDADREEQPITEWIKRTKKTGLLDFAALEKAAEAEVEPYLDALADETGEREDKIKELLAQLSCLCAAVETHPMEQENEFVKQERERARTLLGLYHLRGQVP